MRLLFFLCFICFSLPALAHENHKEKKLSTNEIVQEKIEASSQEGRPTTWTQWIGSFHLIFLHFPLALINMLVVSEGLLWWYRQPLFDYASRFMLISAAVIAPPTALLGLIYSYSTTYYGLMEIFLFWHMWFGISSAVFLVAVAFVRERVGPHKFYYGCLVVLVLMINMTGFFGGGMTFGPFHMFMPLCLSNLRGTTLYHTRSKFKVLG